MIWKTIELSSDVSGKLRGIVQTLLTGIVDFDNTKIILAKEIGFLVHRKSDHIELTWSPAIKSDAPGMIDPDLICARLYEGKALIDLRVGSLRIDYSENNRSIDG
jgi:hypothetical protein